MREILFRGRRIDNGEFIEGHLYGIWDKKYILWGQTNHVPNGEEVIPETIGQFTGIPDENRKMIFEGDIVEWSGASGIDDGIAAVVWNEDNGAWYIDNDELNIYEHLCDVSYCARKIGNIHENPELTAI